MTRFWSVLVLFLAALPAPLSAAPPLSQESRRDGHELPLRTGPAVSRGEDDRPGSGPAAPAPSYPRAVAGRFAVHQGAAAGHVVVRFRDEVPDWQRDAVARGAGGGAYRASEWADFARVEVPEGQPLAEVLRALRSDPAVLWAETDPVYSGFAVAVAPRSHQPINDPFFPLQWNLDRIRWHDMLDLSTTGGRGVVVAVIDSGVAYGDGAAFPARRGIDLEGVTFLPGMDFVDGGPAFDLGVAVGEGPVARQLRFGHGTFVAAQIAAVVNNATAIAGIAPQVSILPVRVLDPVNATTAAVVAEAINFSVAAGADVINLSLGGPDPFGPLDQAVENAVRAGVVVVASAGNEASDPAPPTDVGFPSRIPSAISVGATGFNDARASYSNIGPGLDLSAPAGESPGIQRGATRDAVLSPSFIHDPVTGQTDYGLFFAVGTSFAAPQVAAAAALLIALGVDDPEVVRFVLEETARDVAGPGFDPQTGHGILDLLRAHQGLGFAS